MFLNAYAYLPIPIASRLGIITRSEAVTVTIGGTIITDTAALVLLAFISAATDGSYYFLFLDTTDPFNLSISHFLILWGVPKISAWFFKNLEGESGSQYIFVLGITLYFRTYWLVLAGIEPIIGAFSGRVRHE
jgi:Kef-type K+ transport system membrane component KefB